ncbi:MAG TPA: YceI family protein, partial [Cyclobacteriaceae bacterium]|nr:YceI family protein [Cyclobacteriaceae bacterium]
TINTMKKLILIATIALSLNVAGQNLYKGENGKVRFYSDALLEDIEATTKKVTSVLNYTSGEVAVLIPIRSFVFDKSLMQEHFNENYLESDKFPEASFKGRLTEKFSFVPGETRQVNVSGELLIHGVSIHRDIPVSLAANQDGTLSATGKFDVKVADHKVKIPTLVFQNIAEVVEVSFELTLKPQIQP